MTLQKSFAITAVGLATMIAVVLLVGSALSRPVRSAVGDPPHELRAETVWFESGSGATLAAWFGRPLGSAPVIVLSHGVRGNRQNLRYRAQFLRDAGFGVLVYDAQSHGESTGDGITFGFLESHDARAAVAFVRTRFPESRIGFIGPSLAGASALLGDEPLPVDALVLEAVYPTLEAAVFNRIAMRTGDVFARILTPLLLLQVQPRLGFDPYSLDPIEKVGSATAPLLLLAGSEDLHTTVEESRALFAAAREPKELWIVQGAAHESFHAFVPAEYERRIAAFFERWLSSPRGFFLP